MLSGVGLARAGDKVVPHKVEDTRGAVTVEKPAAIAAFTVTGADGKPVTLDDLKGEFALIAFGRGKDKELSKSKLMRLKDIMAATGAPAGRTCLLTEAHAVICSQQSQAARLATL